MSPFLYSYSLIKSQGRWDILLCRKEFVNTLALIVEIVTFGNIFMATKFNSPRVG